MGTVDAQLAESPLMDQPLDAAGEVSLERARRGDLAAFRELLRAHKARVYSIALRFTGRRADAEELAQDVFLQLHGALAQIESGAHLKHWLLRAVSHRCIDRLRQQERRPKLVSIEALQAGSEPLAPEQEQDPLIGKALRRLLRELAPDARAVLLLRFQEDLDPADIATVLAMPVNTVKSHIVARSNGCARNWRERAMTLERKLRDSLAARDPGADFEDAVPGATGGPAGTAATPQLARAGDARSLGARRGPSACIGTACSSARRTRMRSCCWHCRSPVTNSTRYSTSSCITRYRRTNHEDTQ